MSDNPRPCEHGRNFCMECHYDPDAPRATLPQMLDAMATRVQELEFLQAISNQQIDALTEALRVSNILIKKLRDTRLNNEPKQEGE